jgi:MFS family permease
MNPGATGAYADRPLRNNQVRALLASTIGCTLGYGNLAIVSFGLFVPLLVRANSWSRSQVAVGLTIMTISAVIASPLAGALVDRFGTRRVAVPAIVLLSATFLLISFGATRLNSYYAGYALLGLVGAGTMPITYTRVITSWFDHRRGFALAIALTGTGVGAIILPLLIGPAIADWGMQAAYRLLALLSLAALLPVFFLMPPDAADEVLRRPVEAFWRNLISQNFIKIAGAGLFLGILTGAVWGNLFSLLVDRGLTARSAQLAMAQLAVGLVVGRLVSGYLLDRFFAPYVASFFLLPVVLGLSLLASNVSGQIAVLSAMLLGVGIGAEFDFLAYLVGRYFPKTGYGRTYGAAYCIFSIGNALGPLVMSASADRLMSYSPALWLVAGGVAVAIALLLTLSRYPASSQTEHLSRQDLP